MAQRYCHQCSGTSEEALQCANVGRLPEGDTVCQRTVCKRCFHAFRWDWDAARAELSWACYACRVRFAEWERDEAARAIVHAPYDARHEPVPAPQQPQPDIADRLARWMVPDASGAPPPGAGQ